MSESTIKSLAIALDELKELFGTRLTTSKAVRDHHSHDESWHPAHLPDAVCFVNSAEEVSRAIAICSRHRIPVIAFGTGTGLEGGTVAHKGGICIDTSKMNAILQVNTEDMDCTVQAGVTRKQLDNYLHDSGLFFPIDPGADASLGGMAATRASGTNAVRYGTMRENVLSLKAVMANGSIVTTGNRARKSAFRPWAARLSWLTRLNPKNPLGSRMRKSPNCVNEFCTWMMTSLHWINPRVWQFRGEPESRSVSMLCWAV